jgi:hypothetical protein
MLILRFMRCGAQSVGCTKKHDMGIIVRRILAFIDGLGEKADS